MLSSRKSSDYRQTSGKGVQLGGTHEAQGHHAKFTRGGESGWGHSVLLGFSKAKSLHICTQDTSGF